MSSLGTKIENKNEIKKPYNPFDFMKIIEYDYNEKKEPIEITDIKNVEVPIISEKYNRGKVHVTLEPNRRIDTRREDLLRLIFPCMRVEIAQEDEKGFLWKDGMYVKITNSKGCIFRVFDKNDECIFKMHDKKYVYQEGDCWSEYYITYNEDNVCDKFIVINYGDVSSVMIFETI